MKLIGLSLLLMCICSTVIASPIDDILHTLTVKNCGTSPLYPDEYDADRIVGGKFADPGRYPWMVSLLNAYGDGWAHVCGASILNERWILTAAHCIRDEDAPSDNLVVAGLHRISSAGALTVRRYKIQKIVMHEDYMDDNKYHDDIALLRTTRRIDIKGSEGYINGVCLPSNDKDPIGRATVTGWGHTKFQGDHSDILKEVNVPIVDREVCNNAYDQNPFDDFDAVIDTMICAGEEGQDSCQYDSGGPLVQIKNGVATQIGVVSHGNGCGQKYFPGVYTKVGSYLKWIARVMAKYD